MGYRYRKSIKIGGTRVNLSKSGIGYSVGTKGFRVTKKAGGGTRTTASIPGTGISYVKDSRKQSGSTTKRRSFGSASILSAPERKDDKTANPSFNFAVAFLIWIGTWFACLVALIFAAALFFRDGKMATLYAFTTLIVPVVIATYVVRTIRKRRENDGGVQVDTSSREERG